eukprot:SAG31_NODE_35665_length_321_cov_0.662162_1_plen_77_part_10
MALSDLLAANSSIQEFALNGNRITDVGARALALALRNNRSLRQLWMAGNHFSEDVAHAFAEAIEARPENERPNIWLG